MTSKSADSQLQQLGAGQSSTCAEMISEPKGGSLENIQDTWPLRLLHVETMESIPRSEDQNGVHYGGVREPTYSILSYTWGRYEDADSGEAIGITGPAGRKLDWHIPKVSKVEAFGAEEFGAVLKKVAGDNEFIWVDIACINQNKDTPDYAAEMSKQAAIFSRANQPYVWLHQTRKEEISQSLDLMTKILAKSRETGEGVNALYRCEESVSKRKDSIALGKILEDPWFTSLWTLQEAYIQKDAVLLSKEGHTVEIGLSLTPQLLTVRSLSSICTQIHPYIWQTTRTLIDNAGLHQLQSKNPLSLLSVSARRTSTLPCDKIYGIMQIFGLRLGKTANGVDPSRKFSLEELEEQFAQEVIRSTPTLSQLFVHRGRTIIGYAWRFKIGTVKADKSFARFGAMVPGKNKTIHVPDEFCNALEVSQACKISFPEASPYFEGDVWDLSDLKDRWVEDEGKPVKGASFFQTLDTKTPDMNNFGRSLFLDHFSGIDAVGVPPAEFSSWGKPVTIADSAESKCPGQLSILILGRIRDGETGQEAWAGMLARKSSSRYLRVGFCTWQGDPVRTKPVVSKFG